MVIRFCGRERNLNKKKGRRLPHRLPLISRQLRGAASNESLKSFGSVGASRVGYTKDCAYPYLSHVKVDTNNKCCQAEISVGARYLEGFVGFYPTHSFHFILWIGDEFRSAKRRDIEPISLLIFRLICLADLPKIGETAMCFFYMRSRSLGHLFKKISAFKHFCVDASL